MIRTIIVDDEPLARSGLRGFLGEEPDIEIVGECPNGLQAMESIRALHPDLVLLDIAMPILNGFQVLEALPPDQMPVVIFITAHDHHALEAFEAHAIDYVLKPVEQTRFRVALNRARAVLLYKERETWPDRLRSLLQEMKSPPPFRQRLMIRGTGRFYLLPVAGIDWIEASGNYARLHVAAEIHLLRETLSNLERELDPDRFCRIHRGTIVNLERVQEIQPWTRGDLIVILRDGTRLTLSARHRENLERRLGRPR